MTYNQDIIDEIIDYAEDRYATAEDVLTDLKDLAGIFHNRPEWVQQAEAALESGYPFEEKLEDGIDSAQGGYGGEA